MKSLNAKLRSCPLCFRTSSRGNGLDRSVVAVDGREDIWRGAGACPGLERHQLRECSLLGFDALPPRV